MKRITRKRPKIDRLASPWLIRRFIDPEAGFIYLPLREVSGKAAELNAIPSWRPFAVIVGGADTDPHPRESCLRALGHISRDGFQL